MLVLAEPGQALQAPWDSPAAVKAHIVEQLPGTTFDAQGVGRFVRRTYSITFRLSATDASVIEIEATGAGAQTAVLRVADKAGWTALDFESGHPLGAATDITHDTSPVAPPPPVTATGADGARWKAVAGLAAAVLIAVIGGVRWMRTVDEPPARIYIATPDPDGAMPVVGAGSPAEEPDTGGGLLDFRLRDKDGTLISAEQANAIVGQIHGEVDAARRRVNRVKRVLPQFRDHTATRAIIGYLEASAQLQERFMSRHWISPTFLASPIPSTAGGTLPAPLPVTYRADVRDGYRYTFRGLGCRYEADDPMRAAGYAYDWQMCIDAVYSAVPVTPGQPSFAYSTSDWRLRYRDDGQMPTAADALAADMNPMNPDAPPGSVSSAPPAVAPPPAPSWVGSMFAWFDKATGANPPAPPPAAEPWERPVEADLRAFRVAQKRFADVIGRGRFTTVQRLQDHLLVDGKTLPPPLPASFGTARRHGYRFELIATPVDDDWTRGDGRANGPYFEKYSYVAHPDDPSRRTLAIFQDAAIRVASGRLPASTDPILIASQ